MFAGVFVTKIELLLGYKDCYFCVLFHIWISIRGGQYPFAFPYRALVTLYQESRPLVVRFSEHTQRINIIRVVLNVALSANQICHTWGDSEHAQRQPRSRERGWHRGVTGTPWIADFRCCGDSWCWLEGPKGERPLETIQSGYQHAPRNIPSIHIQTKTITRQHSARWRLRMIMLKSLFSCIKFQILHNMLHKMHSFC